MSELKLLYPTERLQKVNVGIITIKLHKILSNAQYRHDGSLGGRLLACLCCEPEKFEQYNDVTIIDSLRIIRKAKINSTNSNHWIAKGVYCPDKHLLSVQHDLNEDVQASPMFGQEHDFQGHKVVLKPDTVKEQVFLLDKFDGKNIDLLYDAIILSKVKSVDDKKPDIDNLPLSFVEWLNEKFDAETKAFEQLTRVVVKCHQCQKEVDSQIGLFNQDFLLK